MLTILLIASIIASIVFYNKYTKLRSEDFATLCTIFIILSVVLFITIFLLLDDIVSSTLIDEKIAMYQEENIKIEKDISNVVIDYKQYELDVFDKSEIESPVVLVQLYPELKSDTLVQKQIELYINNNSMIKQLKNQQIDYKVSKWWVYFNI